MKKTISLEVDIEQGIRHGQGGFAVENVEVSTSVENDQTELSEVVNVLAAGLDIAVTRAINHHHHDDGEGDCQELVYLKALLGGLHGAREIANKYGGEKN